MSGTDENPPRPTRDHWGADRTQVVNGLRDLAAFIEANTELPIPAGTDMSYAVVGDDDESERAEVDRIAAILGVTAEPRFDGRHYVATAFFGPIIYRAVAITDEEMQRYRVAFGETDVITSERWPI